MDGTQGVFWLLVIEVRAAKYAHAAVDKYTPVDPGVPARTDPARLRLHRRMKISSRSLHIEQQRARSDASLA